MIVYEALTGVRWSIATPVDQADWSGVPGRLAPVLRRALALAPADRWEDAATFREALTRPASRARTGFRKYAPIAAPLVIIAAIIAYVVLRPVPSPPIWNLAVLPVDIVGPIEIAGWEGIDGADIAGLVTSEIKSIPGVSVVPWVVTDEWWSTAIGDTVPPEARAAAGLGARRAAHTTLSGHGDSVEVELDIYDEDGDPLPGPITMGIGQARPLEVSKRIALELVKLELGTDFGEGLRFTDDLDALRQYLLGEENFQRGRMDPAVKFYEMAVTYDSSFATAWWRLANAYRWLGERGPYERDYQELFDRHASDLGVLDSMLMAAQLTAAGLERLRGYRETHERFPLEYFAAFLHGEELFNRGPLWGESLESAITELEDAVRLNPLWALNYMHLIWANIRLGREDEALRYLEQGVEYAPDPEAWTYPLGLFEQAIRERFASHAEVEEGRSLLFRHQEYGQPGWRAIFARLAGAFDVPRTQVELGASLTAQDEAVPRALQVDGHLAQGLGLVGLGHINDALAQFDAAAELLGTPEARLHAAEWRVLPLVAGLDVVEPAERQRGREILESMVGQDRLGVRACWALALYAYAVGDTTARRLSDLVMTAPAASGAEPLGELLYSALLAEQGRYEAAIERSRSLLAVQTPTVLLYGAPSPGRLLSDPFARALLHIKRGEWFEALNQPEAAELEYLWYEAVDVLGLPRLELPQAGEIDWALGNYGRFLRGSISPDRERACSLLNHVLESWSGADPGFAEEVTWAESAAAGCR
jgi:tetratricopeptide (TPR) repeat protein